MKTKILTTNIIMILTGTTTLILLAITANPLNWLLAAALPLTWIIELTYITQTLNKPNNKKENKILKTQQTTNLIITIIIFAQILLPAGLTINNTQQTPYTLPLSLLTIFLAIITYTTNTKALKTTTK